MTSEYGIFFIKTYYANNAFSAQLTTNYPVNVNTSVTKRNTMRFTNYYTYYILSLKLF